jgi:glycosyltransferase involved in cell wall biosynthesis
MQSKRIKVAYILTPITFGGAEKVSLNFLRHVDRGRFDIKPILLTRPWEEAPYFAREIHGLGYDYKALPVALKPRSNGRDPFRVPRVAYHLYSFLKKDSFDVVHTHGYFADICGLPAARLLGKRALSTCHGFISNDRKLKTYNRLDKYALRLCDIVIAVSDGIKNELVSSGIKESKVAVIPNAAFSSIGGDELPARRLDKRLSLSIAPDDFVVGYLGRLSQEKGVNYLVDAFSLIRNSTDQLKLLIVGDGPERKSLEQKVKNSGLENLVVFAGFQEDIENWLPAFDAFVLPSLTEGTPMALLEAMDLGVPVIATEVGGVPKVVTDQENGLLIPPGDHQAISNSLSILINNSELKAHLSKARVRMINTKCKIAKWTRNIECLYCDS